MNGNDPLAVAMVAELALAYRQKFSEDVVIDINCYRKHGHNEADDPAFTQPLLYKKIKSMPCISDIFSEQLVKEGILKKSSVTRFTNAYAVSLTPLWRKLRLLKVEYF